MQRSLYFGRFELRPAARQLLDAGVPLSLGSRAFDVLCALVDGSERVLGKSELLECAWPGLVVEENNLTVQISALRKALGPAAIATVTGRGYRFALPVSSMPPWRADDAGSVGSGAQWRAVPSEDVEAAVGRDRRILLVALAADALPTPSTGPVSSDGIVDWLRTAGAALVQSHGGVLRNAPAGVLLAEFDTARTATACALALRDRAASVRQPPEPLPRIALVSTDASEAETANDRTGDQRQAVSRVEVESDVDRALRLAAAAAPGETLAVATVRDRLIDTIDCRVEDLGAVVLAKPATPVRAYRLEAPHRWGDAQERGDNASALKPLLAVLPFEPRQSGGDGLAIGELIADGLIAMLSHSRHPWRVVSRLSASAFSGRALPLSEVNRHLGAAFIIGGSYVERDAGLLVTMQVVDCRSGEVVLGRRMDGTLADLLAPRSALLEAMLCEAQGAIYDVALRRIETAPVPTLQSYTLMLGGIQLLHRSTPRDFDRSFQVLSQLAQWHPHAPEPRIWLAKWYAMRAVQGQTVDALAEAKAALACTREALAVDPTNAFAMATEGFVHTHLTKDYSTAAERLRQALEQNQSETFAHLFQGVIKGLKGDFDGGLASYETALQTSPRDPARYLMDTIGAYLYLGCGRLDSAIRLAKESLRQNRNHAHSWRVMTIAQQESGALDEARESMRHVRELQPDLTVERYLAGARPDDAARHRFAQALQRAGLPMH